MAEEDNIFRNNGQEFCYIPLNEPGLLSKYTLTNSFGTSIEATIELCYKDSQSEFDPQFLKIGFECPKNMEIDDSTLPVMIIEDYSPIMGQMIPGHIQNEDARTRTFTTTFTRADDEKSTPRTPTNSTIRTL